MESITESEAIEILRKHAPSEEVFSKVLAHSLRVRDIVANLVKGCKNIDIEFLKTASILHDIGRFRYPPGNIDSIKHGIYGAEILRKYGLLKHARVCETHIGVGILKEDIISQGLPLPLKDFIPQTPEEILISYVDNLDSPGIRDEKDVEERFAREVGEGYRKRVRLFHKKVHEMIKQLKNNL